MCAFDGACNVQKAGKSMSINFPLVVCIHEVDHVVSLFFDDAIFIRRVCHVVNVPQSSP